MITETIILLLLTLNIIAIVLLIFKGSKNESKDYVVYWNVIQKSIETNIELYKTIVNYELNNYDNATEVYVQLKNEFTNHIMKTLQGKVIKDGIKHFYGNEANFITYLNDRFDNAFYRKYITLEPVINEKI